MPLSLLNRAVSKNPADAILRPPKLAGPEFDLFITAEPPAISIQLAPALEDLAALTDGIPADLRQHIERLLREQISAALAGAELISVAIGEKPDYALLRADPETLSGAGKGRLALEGLKLLARRQNFGIYPPPEGRSGSAGRRKGTELIDLALDVGPLMDKTGAPFEIKVLTAEVSKAANALIAADAPRYSLQGEECGCGPVAVQSIALRSGADGKVETVVTGQLDLLLGAARAGFDLRVNETLSVDRRANAPGVLADPRAAANIEVLRVDGEQLPVKVKKILERDLPSALLSNILPVGSMLAMAPRALASRVAANKLAAGDEVRGPVYATLNGVLAPQMVKGTDQKIVFDLRRTGTPTGAITLAGVVLVVARKQALRIQMQAAGRLVAGDVFDIRFRANAADMVEPIRYTWACLGEEFSGGAEANFQVDLAAHPEFPVTVEAVDAEGFAAPVVRGRFRMDGLAAGGRVRLSGEPVRR